MTRATTRRTVTRARVLRRTMTLPEVLLWQILRTTPDGIKFRRQHPVGSYVADFYAPAARLIIEIDGIVHDMWDRPERDAVRTAWMEAQGLTVMRIAARDVLASPEQVADSLVRCVRALLEEDRA